MEKQKLIAWQEQQRRRNDNNCTHLSCLKFCIERVQAQFTENNETKPELWACQNERLGWYQKIQKKWNKNEQKLNGELSAGGHSNFLRDIGINKRTKKIN